MTYNRPNLLKENIDSIFQQSIKNIRIKINKKIFFNLLYDRNNDLQKKIKIEQIKKEINLK